MKIRWKIAQFFEAWWWRRYLSGRPIDEYLKWKKAYWESFFEREKISVLPQEKILDAGCGPAGIFMMFQENEVVAVDPLIDKYQAQLAHFQKKGHRNISFVKSTIEAFQPPFLFDTVFCLNAINHVAEINRSMNILAKSLKKGGGVYLSIDAHNFVFFKNIFHLIPGDILHPHQLDLKEYQSLVEANGIKVLETSLIKQGFIFNYYLIKGVKG